MPIKIMPLKKSFSMTWLKWLTHCIIFQMREEETYPQTSSYAFFFFIFIFNQSKNNDVRDPRTGHIRGLVGFEAKTKSRT